MDGLSRLHGYELTSDNRVYVAENVGGGIYLYVVMVNNKPFDELFSTGTLTWSQQWDIADGYKEALDFFGAAMVESAKTN